MGPRESAVGDPRSRSPGVFMKITVAHSPDSDDAFMFYGLASGAVHVEGIDVEQNDWHDSGTACVVLSISAHTRGTTALNAIGGRVPGGTWILRNEIAHTLSGWPDHVALLGRDDVADLEDVRVAVRDVVPVIVTTRAGTSVGVRKSKRLEPAR